MINAVLCAAPSNMDPSIEGKVTIIPHCKGGRGYDDNVPPAFDGEFESQALNDGDTLVLKCNISGQPEPTVEWFKDGKNIRYDEKASTKNRAGLCTLTKPEMTSADSGEYSCRASNEEGDAEIRTTVKVKAKPTTVQINKAPPMDLPMFVEHPQGKLLTDGDQAVIECEVKGNPEVIWYKGNEIIQDNDDFKYETSGDVHRLVIAEVFPEDSGIYRAEASNQTGTTSSHFTIFVKVPDEELSGPVFLEIPRSQNVDEGAPVSFTCRLDNVDTVTWMKGTQVLDDLGRFRITTTDNTSVFTIPAAIATDSGMYAVEVNNEKGNTMWTFTLGVKISASPCADIDVLSLIESVK